MLDTETVRSCSRVHCNGVHSPIDRMVNRRPSEHRGRAAQRAIRRARHRAAQREAAKEEKCKKAPAPVPAVPVLAEEASTADTAGTDIEDEPMLNICEERENELLILLDWDDTVLPTTYLASLELTLDATVPEETVEVLAAYSLVALNTLRCLKSHGRVVIVTNAETGWVELTCAKFLPALTGEMADIERVSARSKFEPRGFTTPVAWKTEAFHEEVEEHLARKGSGRNVLSVGDAGHEREAVYRVAQRLDVAAKSIKLVEQPDLAYLQREHALIQDRLADLLRHEGPLDVRVDAEGGC